MPLKVILELTHSCTFDCTHCFQDGSRVDGELNLDRVLRLLRELSDLGTLTLGLSGGEPLAWRWWREVARAARTFGFDLHLQTNGELLDDRDARLLAELHASVHVSLYSLDPGTFEAIVRRPGRLPAVCDAIRRLAADGARVIVKTPVMSENLQELRTIREWVAETGAEWRPAPVLVPRRNGDTSVLAQRVPLSALRTRLEARRGDAGSLEDDIPLCAAGASMAWITPSGDVLPCGILPMVAGNIRESSFREIWEGSPVLKRLRGLRHTDLSTCSTCAKLAYCGRCPAQALLEDGDVLGPSRWACERAKEQEDAGRRPEGCTESE